MTHQDDPAAADQHRGQGGAYEVRDGVRVLVERTRERADGALEADAADPLPVAAALGVEHVPPLRVGVQPEQFDTSPKPRRERGRRAS